MENDPRLRFFLSSGKRTEESWSFIWDHHTSTPYLFPFFEKNFIIPPSLGRRSRAQQPRSRFFATAVNNKKKSAWSPEAEDQRRFRWSSADDSGRSAGVSRIVGDDSGRGVGVSRIVPAGESREVVPAGESREGGGRCTTRVASSSSRDSIARSSRVLPGKECFCVGREGSGCFGGVGGRVSGRRSRTANIWGSLVV